MTVEKIINRWCDHCGKKIEKEENVEHLLSSSFKGATVEVFDGLSVLGKTYDLCDDCAKELKKFFKRVELWEK